ncbi:MAG TPA: DinB family protein [Thermoanaerobaculia bacterium]|nr:DinB family protein [Thermoanaerobaculia bacterium]
MTPEYLVQELKAAKEYFDRSTRCLSEADSQFSPAAGTWTVAQQVAHAAQTVDWFFEGAFRPEGFSMDFDKHMAEVAEVRSLAAARAWLDRSFDQAAAQIESRSAEELAQPLPAGIMEGMPRAAIVGAIVDHTAHHRGVLTVYSRLLGKVPAMPYMDMPAEEPAMPAASAEVTA